MKFVAFTLFSCIMRDSAMHVNYLPEVIGFCATFDLKEKASFRSLVWFCIEHTSIPVVVLSIENIKMIYFYLGVHIECKSIFIFVHI